MRSVLAELTQDVAMRIAAERSTPEPNSGCWLWEGPTDRRGYAYLSLRKVKYRMGRAVLGLPRGVPGGVTEVLACHHCDTPSCVNPAHLFAGTNADNMLDLRKKGRKRHAVCAVGHPLTPDNLLISRRRDRGSIQRRCRECKRRSYLPSITQAGGQDAVR